MEWFAYIQYELQESSFNYHPHDSSAGHLIRGRAGFWATEDVWWSPAWSSQHSPYPYWQLCLHINGHDLKTSAGDCHCLDTVNLLIMYDL